MVSAFRGYTLQAFTWWELCLLFFHHSHAITKTTHWSRYPASGAFRCDRLVLDSLPVQPLPFCTWMCKCLNLKCTVVIAVYGNNACIKCLAPYVVMNWMHCSHLYQGNTAPQCCNSFGLMEQLLHGANCHPQHNTNGCNDYVDKLKEWGFLDHDVVSNPPVNFPGAATTKHYQPHNIEPSSSQTQPMPMSKGVVLAVIYESVKVEADHLHMVLAWVPLAFK